MIKKALSKLSENQADYCSLMSRLINKSRENGLQAEFERRKGQLHGYLDCLNDMGVISAVESRELNSWFSGKAR